MSGFAAERCPVCTGMLSGFAAERCPASRGMGVRLRPEYAIREICRTPLEGVGKPEPLKHALSGYWSRRIDDTHRIVYKVEGDCIRIAQLRYHY